MSDTLTLPPVRTAPIRRNPQVLVVVGPNQCGKTASVATLPDTLLLELQPGGADYVPNVWAMTREKDLPDYRALRRVLDHLAAQRRAGTPLVKRICLDHLTILDEWMWQSALDTFNESPLGKAYAAKAGATPLKEITDLPGNPGSQGWTWLREELSIWSNRFMLAADEIIYIAHVRDKNVLRGTTQVVMDDINITGRVARKLFIDESSAVARCRRQTVGGEDQFIMNFKSDDTNIPASRCQHLTGREIVVGRSRDGKAPVFDWSGIYLPEPAAQPESKI